MNPPITPAKKAREISGTEAKYHNLKNKVENMYDDNFSKNIRVVLT
jgi:hypothetical protein